MKLNTISMQSESHEFSSAPLESNTMSMKCCRYLNKSEDMSGNYTITSATLLLRARAEPEEIMYHEHSLRMFYMIFIAITCVVSVYITGMNRYLYIADQIIIIKYVMSLICELRMSCGYDCHCDSETESESSNEANEVLIDPTELELSVNIDVNSYLVDKS